VTIKTSFYTFVAGTGSITSIATGGIHPQTIPQQMENPFASYSMDDNEDQQMLDGVSPVRDARFSVDCYSKSYLTASQLAGAFKSALVGHRGTFGSHTVEHIRKEREFDIFEADTGLHRVSLQFLVVYS
jgi:hypothetical protein